MLGYMKRFHLYTDHKMISKNSGKKSSTLFQCATQFFLLLEEKDTGMCRGITESYYDNFFTQSDEQYLQAFKVKQYKRGTPRPCGI